MGDRSNWLRDWWQGLVNQIDGALVNFVFRRRGCPFIFYFTDPAAWEAYMSEGEPWKGD
jgi:hypothetical protein